MGRRTILLLALVALTLVSPAQMHAWQLVDASLREVGVPAGTQLALPAMSADFDGDGKPETQAVKDGRASIQTSDKIRWQSPQAWQVQQALVADLNQDGGPEAVLLVWRPFQPWPVDAWLPHGGRIDSFHDSSGRSCHIILIGWYKDAFHERWAGSALALVTLDPNGVADFRAIPFMIDVPNSRVIEAAPASAQVIMRYFKVVD